MTDSTENRRRIAAKQILEAMAEKGLTRARLADMMGRSRSEATKWLSGNHNFTLDLLAELSQVLGRPITGVEDGETSDGTLHDPAMELIDNETFSLVISRAKELGKSARAYIRDLVLKDTEDCLPKVHLAKEPGRLIRKYSGIVKVHEIEGNEKFDRIWNR